MFEKLAVQYYEEDELSDLLINEVRACMLRSEAVLKKEWIAIIPNYLGVVDVEAEACL